jgi:hypothetical protein
MDAKQITSRISNVASTMSDQTCFTSVQICYCSELLDSGAK